MEHKLVQGGDMYLPFARSRIKSLRATGLKYASQRYVIDGVSISVKLVGSDEFIGIQSGDGSVAVLYESYDHYSTGEFWEVPSNSETGLYEVQIGITKAYAVAANGSRKYIGAANYEWVPYGDNAYGYDGATPLTVLPPDPPAIAPDPPLKFPEPVRNEGVALTILGDSLVTGHTAIYANQANADSHADPIEIDHTQTLTDNTGALVEEWKVHWAVRPRRKPLSAGG